MKKNNNYKKILIDGHVHLYDNFDIDTFVDSITKNFKKYTDVENHEFSAAVKMIFLTEARENEYFSRIENNSLPFRNKDIHAEKTGEKGSILLKQNGSSLFYIIKGRQIITKENIEILSIGPGSKIKDGLPAAEVIEILRERDELAILAWGVGKWFSKRGKIVKGLMKTHKFPNLLIGDNSARPSIWLKPLIYKEGEKLGIPVISGSDPLPLPGEEKKGGSYFFTINGKFDSEKPFLSIKKILKLEIKELKLSGKRDSLFSFLKRQSKILLKKYM
ncbi:MAG: hypothetical protein ABFR75_09150 [Acidobacteriota bacterium]